MIGEYVILRLSKNQKAKAEFNQYLLGIKEIQNTSLASPEHYVFKEKYVVAEYIEHNIGKKLVKKKDLMIKALFQTPN